jgi:phosphocarrier protein
VGKFSVSPSNNDSQFPVPEIKDFIVINFTYILKGDEGLHARPAGNFVKKAQSYAENIAIAKSGKSVDAKRLFSVINLQINTGDEITITVSGANEAQTAKELEDYCASTL